MEAMAQEAAPSAVAEQASIKSNASFSMPHISDGGAALQWARQSDSYRLAQLLADGLGYVGISSVSG